MLCNDMVHCIRRARVRVRMRVNVRVKSRPTGLTFSRSPGYACANPPNSLMALCYVIRVKFGVRVRVVVTVRVPPLGSVLRAHRWLGPG